MSMTSDINGLTSTVSLLQKNILVASGTATIAGVDLKDFIGNMKLILNYAQPSAGAGLQISLLDSADNTTFSALSSPTFANQTASSGTVEVALDLRNCKRYVQCQHVVTGTTGTFTASLIGVGIKQVI
jgi:hypothetical protein